jgi:alpha-glucosidase
MNKKRVWSIIILVAIITLGICTFIYFNSGSSIEGAMVDENGKLVLSLKEDKLEIQVCNDDILRLHYLPDGESSDKTDVIAGNEFDNIKPTINTESNPITVSTEKMKVEINTESNEMTVYNGEGKLLLNAQNINKLKSTEINLKHDSAQSFYGVGGYSIKDNVNGIKREDSIDVIAGMQGYAGGPIAWTTSGYGILVDSDGGTFDIKDTSLEFKDSSKKDVDYYLMIGEPKEIFSSVSEISGKSPLFPKWATGFTNSQWGLNQKQLLSIVDNYRQKEIPIDNFTLDFDWKAWGEDNYGEFRWNTSNFPDGPTGTLRDMLAAKGIKLTAVMKPRIHVDTVEGKYLKDNNLFLESKGVSTDYFSKKQVEDVDFSKKEAREWFYQNTKKATDSGIVGWWNDEADEKSPNMQFLNMQKSIYQGQRQDYNFRVWSLNRNFYLGAQKYAYGMWSGDIDTGFETMAAQRDVMLSAINVGENKWGMDTGGFFGTPDSENYARWMEFSAFVPIFRVHGAQFELRQPWVYGATAEKAATKAINLRYSLLPYIYTYDRQAYDTGVGLVRPLIFDYPKDKNVENSVDAWMFGANLLVSPVVEQGQTEKEIYLPEGNWIDYFNGTEYKGGQKIVYKLNKDTWEDIPLFIKKGAIIPMNSKAIQNTDEKVEQLLLEVFPDSSESSFRYYEDDGKTYNYEKGEYMFQNMKTQKNGDIVTFDIDGKEGNYTSDTKYYICKLHENSAKDLKLDGISMQNLSSIDNLMKSDSEGFVTGKDVYGEVTYIKVAAGQKKSIEMQVSN